MSNADEQAAEAAESRPRLKDPVVREIAITDIGEILSSGVRDFQAAPVYGLFFGGIYAIGGIVIVLAALAAGYTYLAYPLAAGFALIGPFAATGLYEVSRRLAADEPLSFGRVFGVVFQQSKRELGWMAFVTLFILLIWMYQVRLLLAIFLGLKSFASMEQFIDVLVSTPEGLLFLIIGNAIGLVLALVLFSLTVVSFPLLLDRDHDFVTAMITSVRSVTANPRPMGVWAATIILFLIVATLPFFLGLVFALPVLGHATWHLYKRVIAPLDEGEAE